MNTLFSGCMRFHLTFSQTWIITVSNCKKIYVWEDYNKDKNSISNRKDLEWSNVLVSGHRSRWPQVLKLSVKEAKTRIFSSLVNLWTSLIITCQYLSVNMSNKRGKQKKSYLHRRLRSICQRIARKIEWRPRQDSPRCSHLKRKSPT